MKALAPDLWNILGILLSGDQRSQSQCDLDGDQIMADLVTGDKAGLLEVEADAETVDENGTFRQYTSNLLSMPTSAALEAILDIFAVHKSKLTVSDFILTLLEDSKL